MVSLQRSGSGCDAVSGLRIEEQAWTRNTSKFGTTKTRAKLFAKKCLSSHFGWSEPVEWTISGLKVSLLLSHFFKIYWHFRLLSCVFLKVFVWLLLGCFQRVSNRSLKNSFTVEGDKGQVREQHYRLHLPWFGKSLSLLAHHTNRKKLQTLENCSLKDSVSYFPLTIS